ncbi:MAG: glycoside hydrolase family 27 protein, partial [Leadbetterella sp.]
IDCSMIADTNSICGWLNQMYGLDMKKAGAQEYLNSLLNLYASWGVDFIKVDDMHFNAERWPEKDYHAAEVEGYRKAIDQCGRPIILSLSPMIGPKAAKGHVEKYANMWRISADFWDNWIRIKEMFDHVGDWNDARPAGSYPDADMIPFGTLRRRGPFGVEERSNFTPDEQTTLMSFWSVVKSPLMLGGDLPLNTPEDLKMISNPEVLAVNQTGQNPKQLIKAATYQIWTSTDPKGGVNVGVFNISDTEQNIVVPLDQLGLTAKKFNIRDLWAGSDLLNQKTLSLKVSPHGAKLILVKAGK